MTQQPSIGRVVHYESRGSKDGHFRSEPRAAIITAVHWSDQVRGEDWQGETQWPKTYFSHVEQADVDEDEVPSYISSVSLAVLNPTGLFFDEYVPYSEVPKPGHWSWPPRI